MLSKRTIRQIYICIIIILVSVLLYSIPRSEGFEDVGEIGFIVTRCVRNVEQNTLYRECYKAIRKFHPDLKIIFIDDNSNKDVLKEYEMENVEIIQSEYPATGEYLPYWYLLQRKMFKKAIIIQDSMILNTAIPYQDVNDYKFIFEFTPDRNEMDEVNALINSTSIPNELRMLYYSNKWVGCFGSTMVITSDFLQKVEEKVEISRWSKIVNTRKMRMGLERGIALACIYTGGSMSNNSLFGNIYDTQTIKDTELAGKHSLEMYLKDKTRIKDPIIKIWNGRSYLLSIDGRYILY